MSSLVDAVPLLCSYLPQALAGTVLVGALLALWIRWKVLWWLAGIGVLANLVIAFLQAFVLLNPGYDVLFMQPDEVLGWKHVPDLTWTWAGFAPYAADFSVEVRTNSLGFRDLEREIDKPSGTTRIALLGASMIEALQVPLEKTAGQILERQLEAEASRLGQADRFEVLNFGTAAYGTGQALLVWEEYAHRFDPDYVFLYLSPHTFGLTVEKTQDAKFTGATGKKLRVRPLFRMEEDRLVRTPPQDLEEFAAAQRALIANEYGGDRSRRRYHSLLRTCFTSTSDALAGWTGRTCEGESAEARPVPPLSRPSVDDLELNLRIIEELGRQVRDSGSRFVVIDNAENRNLGPTNVRKRLKRLGEEPGLGYLPFHADLALAREQRPIRWPNDIHFNGAGNEVLANAMARWIRDSAAR